jgi:uncharacterized membrane protein HdeD (DUF308 family)
MSTMSHTFHDQEHAIAESIRSYWGLLLAQGIVMMLLGVAAVIWPQISTLAVGIYAGWMFLFSGVTGLVLMFMAPNVGAFLWSLLTSALSLLVGVVLLWHPVEGAVSLTLMLVAFFLVEGIFQIAGAFRNRQTLPESWGWLLMSGIADLVLAALIIQGWPATAVWTLGLFVGLNLISSGLALAMVAAASRKMLRVVGHAAR